MTDDLDYIVKLEKAIKDKYGKRTILNPKSLWSTEKEKKFKKDREIFYKRIYESSRDNEKEEIEGVLVSKKLINKESSRTCPACLLQDLKHQFL